MSNTDLWDKLGKTDPKHTKPFKRAGGFEGTAIKPMFSYRRLTEEFGPCGTGWGVNEPVFQVVPGHNNEVLVFCTVSGWYLHGDKQRMVYGVGGDKVVTHIKANEKYNRPERWENDDEAFKKAFTDALTNAFKLVGVGADVHMGMFDDNKYVNTVAKEFEAERQQAKQETEEPAKSSAQLKREKAWEDVVEKLAKDMLDVRTFAQFEKVKADYRQAAKDNRWNSAFMYQLKDLLEGYEATVQARVDEDNAAEDTVGGIINKFPGSRVTKVTAREQHYLEAGE